MLARKHAKEKQGKHQNQSKARGSVGRRPTPCPTLDAPAGVSNTLNSLLDVNHVQKESNNLQNCMETLYYACKTTGDRKLTVSRPGAEIPPSLPELQVCYGSSFGEGV